MKLTRIEKSHLERMLYVFELAMKKQSKWQSDYLHEMDMLNIKECKELVQKLKEMK